MLTSETDRYCRTYQAIGTSSYGSSHSSTNSTYQVEDRDYKESWLQRVKGFLIYLFKCCCLCQD